MKAVGLLGRRAAVVLLAVTEACCSICHPASGQTSNMQYQQLPADLRDYADKTRRSCKDQGEASQSTNPMRGITVIDLDGNGSRDLLVDAEYLCNGWIKGGNCSNRGCDMKIWKQVGQRSWRIIFDAHLHRNFISLNDKNGLNVIVASIYAGSAQCEPQSGVNYTSGQSCDVFVRYRNGGMVWEGIK